MMAVFINRESKMYGGCNQCFKCCMNYTVLTAVCICKKPCIQIKSIKTLILPMHLSLLCCHKEQKTLVQQQLILCY